MTKALNALPLATKITLLMSLLIACLAIGLGVGNYLKAGATNSAAIKNKLETITVLRQAALDDYIQSIEQDIRSLAANPATANALVGFTQAWTELGSNAGQTLQALYIHDNPHPVGQKENLDRAMGSEAYHDVHAAYHPALRTFLREKGYYDIFLFDTDANLIYSVFKELDYATNLTSGQWRDTDLGNAARAALASQSDGALSFFDFKPYGPSADAPASFISTPVFGANGRLLGALVFQMPIERINQVMGVTAGLGETGEAFIVGQDHLMRSQSRFSTNNTILARRIDTPAARAGLDGRTGVIETVDYAGTPVLSAYSYLDVGDARWAIVAKQSMAEITAPLATMRHGMLLTGGLVILLGSAVGFFVSRRLTAPITRMTGAMRQLADGDVDIDVPARGRGDEIGEMAAAVDVFRQNAVDKISLEAEQAAASERLEAEKRRAMAELADGFEASVDQVVGAVSSAADQLVSLSQSLSAAAGRA
ncbi:MAG: cache domain-containing protein, partial [Pseudomonadota bacterium]